MTVPTASALRDARTVAIVVHGVGDHSPVDIIGEAEKHLAASTGIRTARLKLEDFPRPDEAADLSEFTQSHVQEALEVRIGDARHVVVPVHWSRYRLRAGRLADSLPASAGFMVLMMALPALVLLCLDAIRCVPRARIPWMPGVAGVALLVMALVALIGWGAFYLVNRLPFWLGVGAASFGWLEPLVLVLATLVLGLVLKWAAKFLDFAGDITAYVGRDRLRSEMETKIAEIVEKVAAWAPEACVVVVGHSLGSVLVLGSLLRLSPDYPGAGRTVLVTLGSPLRTMARVFPRRVLGIEGPSRQFARTQHIVFWANLWRDGDFIGRDLRLSPKGRCAEASLGAGPHWNYWGEGRLWRRIGEILEAVESGSLQALGEAWRPPPLDAAETWELARLRSELRGQKWFVTLLAFFVLSLDMRGVFWAPWPWVESAWTLAALRAGWIAGFAAMIVNFYLTSESLRLGGTERESLSELRLRVGICRLTVVLTLLAVGAIHFVSMDPALWSTAWPG